MLFRVRRIIKDYQIKNAIFFGASELKTLYFSFLGFDLNVIVRHGTTKSSPKRGPVHRLVYSRVNYHVALSRHLLNNVKSILPDDGRAKFKIITSSYNYNSNIENAISRTDDPPIRIIHVGRIAPGKGQIEAVLACEELSKRGIDFRLELLGGIDDKRYMEQLKAVIDKTGLGERVELPGHVSDVSAHMANADLLLFPSYGEGMSNALIESLHFGLVSICFDNTVFSEFVEMGFRIILVKDRDQLDLNRNLVLVVEHLENEKNKVKNNKALALRYFNANRERDDWKTILQ